MSKPVIALVGRPNVGKSTLFNKLTGKRASIVDDKVVINKTKAREWLTSHFDGTDEIEWINRPVKKEKKLNMREVELQWLVKHIKLMLLIHHLLM